MRTTPRWIPGGVPLAVSPRGLVALREDLGLLESMWQETEAGQGLEEVLQVLVRAHGNDVFTLPDFLAVSVEEDAVRVVGSWQHIGVSRETWVGMCVVLKNEGMIFDYVTSPLPVVVGVGVFSCLMFHVKLFH